VGENNTNTTGTTTTSDTSTASGINSQIESLQNELSNVKKNYSNLVSKVSQAKSELVSGKITAKKTYDEAMLNYKNAKEIYDIAMDGIDDEVDDAKEQVKEVKKTLTDYEKMVKNGVITSDYAGTILSLGYAEGDTLNTSTAIASFADADAVTVSVSVSQEDVSTIAIGDVVNIVFSAYEEETYSGVVSAIDTAETSDNSSTIDYDVTVKVTGDVSKIYQGMTSNVTFITKELKNVVYVSNKAIQTEGTKSYVKEKEGNTIVKKEVVTGFSNGSSVEIQSGLEEGDVVLIESQVSSS
jgi:HlyD family secretion protein